MASSAIHLTIVVSVIIARSANGFPVNFSGAEEIQDYRNSNFPVQPFVRDIQNVNEGPIAGYPKVPPPNAFESGGSSDDLLPPLDDASTGSQQHTAFKRSIKGAVDPKTGYPLLAEPSWKDAGGNEYNLELPFEHSEHAVDDKAVDAKTGYPLRAQPSWKYAGGDEQILDLPVESSVNNAKEGVDPKTGYPLVAQSSWKEAGGTGDILQLPVEDEKINVKVDPKTGYPLMAEDSWKDAGGNEDTIALPLEDTTNGSKNRNEGKVDPKTGYPLVAQPHWAEAGGNGDILELPLDKSEDKGKVDPKTGYPLEAEPGWAVAGGDETILDLPLEDVKTEGFPLTELRPPDVGSSYSTGYQDPFIDSPSPATFQNPGGAAKDFFDDSSRARESQQSQFMPISLRTNPAKNIFDFNGPDSNIVLPNHFLDSKAQLTSTYQTESLAQNSFDQIGFSPDVLNESIESSNNFFRSLSLNSPALIYPHNPFFTAGIPNTFQRLQDSQIAPSYPIPTIFGGF